MAGVKQFRTQAINKNLLVLKSIYKQTELPSLLNMDLSYSTTQVVDFVYKSWGIVYLNDEDLFEGNWEDRMSAAKTYAKPVVLITRSPSVPNDLFNKVQFLAIEQDIKVIGILSVHQLVTFITNITRDKKTNKPLVVEKFNPESKFKRNYKIQQTVGTIPGVEGSFTKAKELLEKFQSMLPSQLC